jgi:hypothetical protein
MDYFQYFEIFKNGLGFRVQCWFSQGPVPLGMH